MDKNVVYPYDGILFSKEKEWSTDTGHNMFEPWKHYTMWKKPDSKGHVLYDSVYVKGPE